MIKKLFLPLILGLMMVMACTEKLDLPQVEPRLVAFGLLTNNATQIQLSETISKTNPNVFPDIENAEVEIKKEDGSIIPQVHIGEGNYVSTLLGLPGQTYEMTIDWKGEEYRAVATMPDQIITIDSVWHEYYIDSVTTFEFSRLTVFFKDSPQQPTYGLITARFNGRKLSEILFVDSLNNAQTQSLVMDIGARLATGITVEVEFAQFEAGLFEYLLSVDQLNSSSAIGGLTIAPPVNIIGNLTNDGLGYFGTTTLHIFEKVIE